MAGTHELGVPAAVALDLARRRVKTHPVGLEDEALAPPEEVQEIAVARSPDRAAAERWLSSASGPQASTAAIQRALCVSDRCPTA